MNDTSQPFPPLTHRKTHRVRGPRPCSWISSSSDSSSNELRDAWPWTVGRLDLRQDSTLCSASSTESEASDSSTSSTSSSPATTPRILEDCERRYYHYAPRRKPAGPRAPRNSACMNVRPRLMISTPLSVIPQLEHEDSPIALPVQSADMLHSPQIQPLAMRSPTNFLLDWDAIFEILACAEVPSDTSGSW